MKKVLCLLLVLVLSLPAVGMAAAAMKISKATATLFLNKDNKTGTKNTVDLDIKNRPSNYKAKYSFTWYADDSAVEVDKKTGIVTAKKVGSATVKCDIKDRKTGKTKQTLKCVVTVKANAKTVVIDNAPANNELQVGETFDFNRTMTAADGGKATDKTEWSVGSKQEKYGEINASGKFTAKKAGEVKVYCKTYQSKATKDQGYTAESEPVTITVYEKKPSGLSGVAPSVLGGSDGKILGTTDKMEYAADAQFSNPKDCLEDETTGLTAGTYYVRYKATKKKKASDYTTVAIPDGKASELTGTVEITGEEKFGRTLTAVVKDTNNTGVLSYQWKRGDDTDIGSNSDKYTLVKEDINNAVKCVVTSDKQAGSIVSAATGIIAKADGPEAPAGLYGVAPSYYGGSDGKISGTTAAMEYSKADNFASAVNCADNATSGLSAGTYYVRYKETETHKVGVSASVTVPEGEWYEPSVDATVSPDTASFDKYVKAKDYADLTFTLNFGSYTLNAVKLNKDELTATDDYTVDGNKYTIKKEKLAKLGIGNSNIITFDMDGGADPKVTLTVVDSTPPALTGTVTISGTTKFGEKLTAAFEGSYTGILSYQWKRGGADGDVIDDATDKEYTIVKDDIDKTLACVVTSSFETGSIASLATGVIDKADGPEAPEGLQSVAPSSYGGSDGIITYTKAAMEYSTSADFTSKNNCADEATGSLTAGMYYVRYKETETHKVGVSASVTVPEGERYEPSVDATVSPDTARFDRYAGSEDYGDKAFTLTAGSYTLSAVKLNGSELTLPDGYTVNGNIYTIKKEKLAAILVGDDNTATITFDMSGGADPAVTLTVVNSTPPELTGTVTISGTPKFGEKLTATVDDHNCVGTLLYQWKRGGVNGDVITGANNSEYTTTVDDIKKTLTCVVTSSIQAQTGSIYATTGTIDKANNSDVPVDLTEVEPSKYGMSDGKIHGTSDTMEYSAATTFTSSNVCGEGETTGLAAGTYYVRYTETETHKASAYTSVTIPACIPDALTGTATIGGTPKFGEKLTATVDDHNCVGTLLYQWKRGGVNGDVITGANDSEYTTTVDDINKTLACVVTSSIQAQTGSIYATTGTIDKADGPAAPVNTGNSLFVSEQQSDYDSPNGFITIQSDDDQEYKKYQYYFTNKDYTGDSNNPANCASNRIEGLTAGYYYFRFTETDTHYASQYMSVPVIVYIYNPQNTSEPILP